MITIYLATVIGWYLVIISLFFLIRYNQLKLLVIEISEQRALFFILSVITLILGLLMVASHNIWVVGWPIIITLFSWLVLISGLFRLFYPDIARKMGESFLKNPMRMKVMNIIFFLIGLFLLFKSYSSFIF